MRTKNVHERAREAGFVYVLHFHEKLGDRAVHYIGCTSDIRGRLACHAAGESSAIMRACHNQGVSFELAALGQTHRKGMRRIERQAKDWKNAAEFCEVCSGTAARAIPGTRPYPIDMLPFPRHSEHFKSPGYRPKPVTVALSSPRTPIFIQESMRALADSEKDALGFIPMGGARGVSEYLVAGQVVLAQAGRDLVGYLLFGRERADADGQVCVTVHQAIVADARRGCGVGRRMVEKVREARPGAVLRCRVREDLEANHFWPRVGFIYQRTDTHETSGAALNLYESRPVVQPHLFAEAA